MHGQTTIVTGIDKTRMLSENFENLIGRAVYCLGFFSVEQFEHEDLKLVNGDYLMLRNFQKFDVHFGQLKLEPLTLVLELRSTHAIENFDLSLDEDFLEGVLRLWSPSWLLRRKVRALVSQPQ